MLPVRSHFASSLFNLKANKHTTKTVLERKHWQRVPLQPSGLYKGSTMAFFALLSPLLSQLPGKILMGFWNWRLLFKRPSLSPSLPTEGYLKIALMLQEPPAFQPNLICKLLILAPL